MITRNEIQFGEVEFLFWGLDERMVRIGTVLALPWCTRSCHEQLLCVSVQFWHRLHNSRTEMLRVVQARFGRRATRLEAAQLSTCNVACPNRALCAPSSAIGNRRRPQSWPPILSRWPARGRWACLEHFCANFEFHLAWQSSGKSLSEQQLLSSQMIFCSSASICKNY